MITGGVTSNVQVAVRLTAVAALPQASVAFQVLVCERLQPFDDTAPSVKVGVTRPQLSVAVAVPSAAFISAAVGLQPSTPLVGVPVAVITGASVSSVQVAVRLTGVAALPHASVTFQVLVCERLQPFTITAPSVAVGVTGPQLSVAVAVPNAASIIAAVGLQPSIPSAGVPVAVITGAVKSTIQVAVRLTGVAAFWQASVTFQVLVCERRQPFTITAPSVAVGVTGPQLSVAQPLGHARGFCRRAQAGPAQRDARGYGPGAQHRLG